MTTSNDNSGIPIIIFIPFLLCIVAIVFLLNLRRQQQQAGKV